MMCVPGLLVGLAKQHVRVLPSVEHLLKLDRALRAFALLLLGLASHLQ
jgi:hypothetical protein